MSQKQKQGSKLGAAFSGAVVTITSAAVLSTLGYFATEGGMIVNGQTGESMAGQGLTVAIFCALASSLGSSILGLPAMLIGMALGNNKESGALETNAGDAASGVDGIPLGPLVLILAAVPAIIAVLTSKHKMSKFGGLLAGSGLTIAGAFVTDNVFNDSGFQNLIASVQPV